MALVCGDSKGPGGGAGAGPRGPPSAASGLIQVPAPRGPEDGGPGPQALDSAVQVRTAMASKLTADSERPAAPRPVLANFSSESA